ncbi:Uma2 family endonuclease [Limnofasciculus baicalensis]|uniref:Uma2 family endonuclease n=1 Tax=Limnofasciculus baicalensis BBK-W-15 TaxID=2699891 RepID=A0AAE3KLZ3_9CYAN|nr:Uma2 family endonuclease [Limnofasciculus baicalensis]MCP2728206.1 Uma2 family endonuclease [Limnofasciculus baicalensis BBK-W-15]
MFNYNPLDCLPSAEDLPDSDDTPVDNELQDLIPTLLKASLALLWAERWDWYFGVDMGIYYHPDADAIVPDGFLSLGVHRVIDEDLRLSYVVWEEEKMPIFVLEVVSHRRRGEYSFKKQSYQDMGVLYYAVYNPLRKRKSSLELYKLVQGVYQLQSGNPVWLPEVGLGIGSYRGIYQGIQRQWLSWFDEDGNRFPTPEEAIQIERQRAQDAEVMAQQQRELAQKLAAQLRKMGIEPDSVG